MKVQVLHVALLLCFFHLGLNGIQAQDADDFFFEEPESNKEPFDFDGTLQHVRGILVEGNEQQQAMIGRSHKKLNTALEGFLKTPFMDKYRDIKLEAESLAGTFKALTQKFSPTEVGRVRNTYNRIASKFNRLLVEIKNDFMDRKKMKLIKNQPEMYSNSLQFKLMELKEEYSQDFERTVAEITGSDVYAAVPLGIILGLVKLSMDFTRFLAAANYESRRIKEEHLNQFLIEPYRFRLWEDIPIGEGDSFVESNSSNRNSDQSEYNPDASNGTDADYMDADDFQAIESDTTPFGSTRIKNMNPFEETTKKSSSKAKTNKNGN